MPKIPAQSRTVDLGPPSDAALKNAQAYETDLGELGLVQHRVWAEQEAFLAEFREHGMKGTCAIRAGIHRETVRLWERGNLLNFNARLTDAMEVYVDLHEERLTELAFTSKHPLPSIATLNARRPEYYKRETIIADNRALDALNEIKAIVAEARQRAFGAGEEEAQTLEARAEAVIEGKARVVEEAEAEVEEGEGVWLSDG